MRDISKLSASNPFTINPFEEKRIDLSLKKLGPIRQTVLRGIVLSEDTPIAGATVEVLSFHFNPLFHTQTNANGMYEFSNILKPGKYRIMATADGYELSPVLEFLILNHKSINISLRKDPLASTSVVYGTIKDKKTQGLLSNATISLFKVNQAVPFATTVSNFNGEYLIPDIPLGQYQLLVEKNEYLPSPLTLIPVQNHRFIKTDILLTANIASILGTISGIIENFIPCINHGFVTLYKIEGNIETLIQIKTLNSKNYLFTNVEPGTYIVRAGTKQEVFFQTHHTFS